MIALDIPHGILCWIIDFLKDRKQRVKLDQDCKSEWGNVPPGIPQGTKLSPWLFILTIDINTSDTEIWKYVDDTSIAEPVAKNQASMIQDSVNELVAMSDENKFELNESKCKEIRISFANTKADFASIIINEKAIKVVSSVKLLGLNISDVLKWKCHVSEISREASARLYYLKQLMMASVCN